MATTEIHVHNEMEMADPEVNKLLTAADGDKQTGQVPPPSAPRDVDDEKIPVVRQGQFIELQFGEKIINFKVKSVTDHHMNSDTKGFFSGPIDKKVERTKTLDEIHEENVSNLMPDSTNAWLYVQDSHAEDGGDTDKGDDAGGSQFNCSDNLMNRFIAWFVIALQIVAYSIMASMLSNGRLNEFAERKEASRGPYADKSETYEVCMNFSTGGLTSLLLVGFLWADVVNIMFIATRKRTCNWIFSSMWILAELIVAIVCGFIVGLYSENDFDAIGGAVGILFVHDLDEKVFASMESFRGQKWATGKKLGAIGLWIIISLAVAFGTSCTFIGGGLTGNCLIGEFECGDGQCIWEGKVCNGVEDCDNGFDERSDPFRLDSAGNPMTCDFTLVDCGPEDEFFRCNEDGSCIPIEKKCNGILDCPAGWDEAREQNCPDVIRSQECPMTLNITKDPEFNDDFHEIWTGSFKCNNGQCIDAVYACDGVPDCVDGSDEYPEFNKRTTFPFMRNCPYDQLVTCAASEVLCKVDGQCISKRQQCDGVRDCSDGSDEAACELREEYDCWNAVANENSFQCGQPFAKVNDSHALFFKTGNDTEYRALAGYSVKTKQVLKSHFDNVHGKCLPLTYRCDGVYDCGEDDISDEEACELFPCGDDEYRCKDSGKCIALSFMCDGENDCDSGEDEELSTCGALGVDFSENECTKQGFFYQCKGYADICLYQDEICDGYQDCPRSDDEEDVDLCNAAKGISNVQQESTVLTCGQTSKGYVTGNTNLDFKFTVPEGSTTFKITTCVTEHQAGFGYMTMANAEQTFSLFSEDDYSKCPCPGRVSLIGGTDSGVVAGTEYDFTYSAQFSGNYAFQVECGTTKYEQGGQCANTDVIPDAASIVIHEATCDGSFKNEGTFVRDGPQPADVWKFTPTGDKGMYFDGCESSFDTIFQIWNNKLEALFNNDDHAGCTANSLASYIGITNDKIIENPGDVYLAVSSEWADGQYSFVCGEGLGDFDAVAGAGAGAHGHDDYYWYGGADSNYATTSSG